MNRYLLAIFGIFAFAFSANATHNRAGEITYRHISGNTYEFTVKTCTKTSAPADRPFLPIIWGDGSMPDSLERDDVFLGIGSDTQQNTYIKQHTFPGPGTYTICISDPNRNGGILNIFNSVLVPFGLKTTLRISAAFEPNNSVFFTNTCLQDACLFQPWIFNPGVVEPDGLDSLQNPDSLSFKLVKGLTDNCAFLDDEVYNFPNEVVGTLPPNNQLTIDNLTGTITWNHPQMQGLYNIAFVVEEWRDGILLGTVLRDMQIVVDVCSNVAPELEAIADTCVEAGQNLSFSFMADDPDGDDIILEGFGSPFQVPSSSATLSQNGNQSPVTGNFNWATNCSHVQLQPYLAIFQASDITNGTSLVAIQAMNITVVAPAPENLVAEAVGSSINLTWEPEICSNAIGYKIYRRINPFGFIPGHCETGVPAYTGYVLIDTVLGIDNTTYVDEDEVIFGRENCYMVVACFADGAESYASNESCAEIKFEIPIIKKNSVGITAQNTGVDTVFWRSPIELDSTVFPGPYQYKLLRSDGYDEPDLEVFATSVEAELSNLVTEFISSGLNTADTAHTYRVELYSNGEFAAQSNSAASLFLQLIPNDNQIELTWVEEIPWINFEYDIYRQTDGTGDFEFLATSFELGYTDTGLVNNREYCYYIVSHGSYFAIEENDTLINYSQRACSQPYDRTPPCPPVLTGDGYCVEFTVSFEWSNPNDACDDTDDVTAYNVYFTPLEGGEFELLESMQGATQTAINLFFENSIAGCYVVTALDSLSLWPTGEVVQNESAFSNIICLDNCPTYNLPNVFTPNGDGRNDIFQPFPYRSIESVEFTIFNRWGNIVFTSSDPDLLWDGLNPETGTIVSDGTYFYTANVFSIRLAGIDPINLSGYIQVFGQQGRTTD